MTGKTWFERIVIRLMGMEVNSTTYLLVVLSIWHSIVIAVVGANSEFILLGVSYLNYIGGIGATLLATWLIWLLASRRWRPAAIVSHVLTYFWTLITALLVLEGEWYWVGTMLAYVAFFTYLSLGCSMHHKTGYPLNRMREHYIDED